jgi:hypothetical protein
MEEKFLKKIKDILQTDIPGKLKIRAIDMITSAWYRQDAMEKNEEAKRLLGDEFLKDLKGVPPQVSDEA